MKTLLSGISTAVLLIGLWGCGGAVGDARLQSRSIQRGQEGGTQCGPTTCPIGQECCNPSCGICVNPGEFCIQIACEPCGDATCAPGLECCNPLAGICVQPGDVCILGNKGGERCGISTCGPGEYCCNESCGICAPFPDGVCTLQVCYYEY